MLKKLSGTDARILRPVAPPPDKPTTSRHEVFHDVLALAILDWRRRYVHAREQAKAQEKAAIEASERLRKRITKALQAGLLLVSILAGTAVWQWRSAEKAHTRAEASLLLARSGDPTLKLPYRAFLASEAIRKSPSPDLFQEADPSLRRIMTLLPRHVARLQHGGVVADLAFEPNGKYLATASSNSTAHLWETATGNELKPMKLNRAILSVAFSPDGKHIATTSNDRTV